jgi:uncharacterized protein
VAFSAPVAGFAIYLGSELPMTSRMLMWCPGAAALVTCGICKIDVRTLGWRWPSFGFLAWSYWIPWLYAVPVYIGAWLLLPGSFKWDAYVGRQSHEYGITSHAGLFAGLFAIPTTMVFIVIGTMAWALGEELGWRGFLVPRLVGRLGFVRTGLATGLLWAVWHYPVLLGSSYNAGTPALFAVTCFTITVVAAGVVQAWLRLASGSLWPCVLFHASHNTLIQGVLDAMTAKTGEAPYVTTEFGAGIALLLTATALTVIMLARKQDKERHGGAKRGI